MQVLPIFTYNNHRLSSSPKVKYVLGKFNVKRQTPCAPKCHQKGPETYSIKGISHSVMIYSVVTVRRYCHKIISCYHRTVKTSFTNKKAKIHRIFRDLGTYLCLGVIPRTQLCIPKRQIKYVHII